MNKKKAIIILSVFALIVIGVYACEMRAEKREQAFDTFESLVEESMKSTQFEASVESCYLVNDYVCIFINRESKDSKFYYTNNQSTLDSGFREIIHQIYLDARGSKYIKYTSITVEFVDYNMFSYYKETIPKS